MTRRSTTLWSLAALLFAAASAGAASEGFREVFTKQDLSDFYQRSPDILKKQKKYQEDAKRRQESGQDEPDAALQMQAMNGEEGANDENPLGHESPEAHLQDLYAEYLVEKGQIVEENIWLAAEEKADQATRQLYRDYLRRIYYHGHAAGDDTGAYVQAIRAALETPNGYQRFPREIMAPPPIPGAAATYGGGLVTMAPGVFDMAVHEHEWLHWWDDQNGSMDGQRGKEDQVEPYAYDNMGRVFG